MLYFLLEFVLLRFELLLGLHLRLLYLFLYLTELVLQFLHLAFVDFVGCLLRRLQLLLFELLLEHAFEVRCLSLVEGIL